MKLKSLFLTSMVALALGACSNATENATTGDENAEKTAVLQVNLGFNNMTTSRASGVTENPKTGDTYVGTTEENNVSTITLRIHYTAGAGVGHDATVTFQKSGTSGATDTFTKEATDANDKTPYTLSKIQVYPGQATIFAVANSSSKVGTTDGTSDEVLTSDEVAAYTTNSYLVNNVAKDNSFLMTGSVSATILPNITNTPDNIYLDRVVAKIQEKSAATYGISTSIKVVKTDGSSYTASADNAIPVNIDSYALYNLNHNEKLFGLNTPSTALSYLHPFVPANNDSFESQNVTFASDAISKTATSQITYCLENGSAQPTIVVYKAIINDGADFYVVKDNQTGAVTLYKSFEALDNANNNGYTALGLTRDSNADDFYKVGVLQYKGGVCYYKAKLYTTTSTNNIVTRNNWYIININSIKNIGGNFIDPKKDPEGMTWLDVTCKVNPWIYQVNSFEF